MTWLIGGFAAFCLAEAGLTMLAARLYGDGE
jgi:hypothetical protein